MEWVEVRGKSVEVAIEAALAEMGLSSREEAVIEIVEEPTRGFLGVGSREALVRVSPKPKTEKRQRRRRKGGSGGENRSQERDKAGRRTGRDSGGGGSERNQRQGSKRQSPKTGQGERKSSGGRGGREGQATRSDKESPKKRAKETTMEDPTTPEVEIGAQGQAEVVAAFLNGLLDSFGLEGTVTTEVEDDLILADVTGEQSNALVGAKGAIMQSVGELARTVVQRKTHRRARLRLDIGGYQERRREALRIYTARLAEQVLGDGGEIMLEAMNPADRKTVHDAVVDIEGVSSFSEGEEPNRSVVIALAPGVEPRASDPDEAAVTGASDSDAE